MPAGRRQERASKGLKVGEATAPPASLRSPAVRLASPVPEAVAAWPWPDPPSPVEAGAGGSLELGPPTKFLNPKIKS